MTLRQWSGGRCSTPVRKLWTVERFWTFQIYWAVQRSWTVERFWTVQECQCGDVRSVHLKKDCMCEREEFGEFRACFGTKREARTRTRTCMHTRARREVNIQHKIPSDDMPICDCAQCKETIIVYRIRRGGLFAKGLFRKVCLRVMCVHVCVCECVCMCV